MTGRHAAPAAPPPYPSRPAVVQAQWWERLPAPLPPLLGLMAGILLGFGSGWAWPLAALGLVVAGFSRRYWLLPLVLLAGLLGQWREQTWEHAPNVLAGYVGGNLTLKGHWVTGTDNFWPCKTRPHRWPSRPNRWPRPEP